MAHGSGKIQKKVLVLLAGGLALAFTTSLGGRRRIWRAIAKEWEKIDRKALHQSIASLYRSKLVGFKEKGDGVVEMILTKSGKKRALEYNIDTLRIKKLQRWDGLWRIVCFDIPKEKKKTREAFRFHLKRLGFRQLQKSVFIIPYPCEDELDFLIEFYNSRSYVRCIVATEIDNALHLKHQFGLM